MADIKKFPTKPYFDDFDEEKNFLRVLFRPGYSVQTRELNQLQTILQDQIGVLADFSVPDGSSIIGGKLNLIKAFPFIKLSSGAALSKDLEDYKDATFTATNGVEGTIKFAVEAINSDPTTLYVKFDKSGSAATPANGSIITVTFADDSTELLTLKSDGACGFGSGVVMEPGIFYINKSFIRTDSQLLLVNKYSSTISTPEISIGIYAYDRIIRPEQDISLLDNATGEPNESSPGAHRFKSDVILSNKANLTTIEISSYKELMKIVFGEVAARPRLDSDVTVLEQILARRTFDESGDYVIDDFVLDVREHLIFGNNSGRGVYSAGNGGLESKLALQFDSGLAYVKGFEVRTAGNAIVPINKARTTTTKSNTITQLQFSNALFIYDAVGMPKLYAKVELYKGTGLPGDVIGSAFIRAFQWDSTRTIVTPKEVFKMDLVAVKFNADFSWNNVTIVKHDDSVGIPFSAKITSYSTSNADAIFDLAKQNAASILPRVLVFNKSYTASATAGVITLSTGNPNETPDDELSSFLIQHPTHGGNTPFKPQSVSVTGNTATINIANTANVTSAGFTVIAKIYSSAPTIRTKTLVPNFVNGPIAASASITLSKADVVFIQSIVSSTAGDVTSLYTLDTGARDSYYDFASIKLKAGESVPSGNLTITYIYFEHGGSGDFFAPNSYSSIEYKHIPTYKLSDGTKKFLGSVLDFRQRITSSEVLEAIGNHSFVPNDQFISDVTFYLPRVDKVVLTRLGEFKVLAGTPSEKPMLKAELPNSITLYDLFIPAYTFKPSDVVISKSKHRRFTMKDIGKIESRVDNIEEVTLLNGLERDIQSQDFKDRFKSGFIADNFSSQRGADTSNPLHRCAYDLLDMSIRPRTINTGININLLTSSGIRTHDDGNITIAYTDKPLVAQMLASDLVRIQPYMVYSWNGQMELTPSTDIWFDHRSFINTSINGNFFASREVSDDFTREDSLLGGAWNFSGGVWRNGSTGAGANSRQASDLSKSVATSGLNLGSTSTSTPWTGRARLMTTTTTAINSVRATESISAIPFIRSRWVNFEATGMKPGTTVYPFFDGVDVSAHCRPIPGTNLGEALVVNGNGSLSGWFVIPPNTFRTGRRGFVLKDTADASVKQDATGASATYGATGIMITSTTNVDIGVTTQSRWYDPVAQSFFVEPAGNPNGAFIQAVDLYFGIPAIDPRYTATCEIRTMVNGYPSSTNVVASKTLPGSSITGSANASVATRFTFTSPVYLEADEEYCIVIHSPDDKSTVWGTTLGKKSYNPSDTVAPSGEIISKQPYLGSMFKSQNNTTWTAEQTQDLKFVVHKCVFSSSATVTYVNGQNTNEVGGPSDPHKELLWVNPLRFTNGSTNVSVIMYGHGFSVGDTVTLTKSDAATGSPYGGIPHTQLFGVAKTITAVTTNSITFAVSTAATATGSAGGSNVFSTWFVDYSNIQLISDCVELDGTNLGFSIQGRLKNNYATNPAPATYVVNDESFIDMNATYVAKTSNDGGVRLNVSMSTSDANVSPVVKESRMVLHATKYVVNNTKYLADNGSLNANPSPAAYVQNTVKLESPATELRVIFDANLPSGTSVAVYYKVAPSDIAEAGEWKALPLGAPLVHSDDPAVFREQRFEMTMPTEFKTFKVMIQMLSANQENVPVIKSYRALALAV